MPKRQSKSLVCQHLENISRAVLEEHQDIIRQYVRGRQGAFPGTSPVESMLTAF
jgi:hypothetical protein